MKGTERPETGEYEHHNADGIYACAACQTPLYKSGTKFNSGCGWPAFFDGNPPLPYYMLFSRVERASCLAIPGAVTRHVDHSLGMERIEITCTACGGHLGHVFKGEGYRTPSGLPSPLSFRYKDIDQSLLIANERHCVNSISLSFAPDDKEGGES